MKFAEIRFEGCDEAEWFSREITESLRGVLAKNVISDPEKGPVGAVTASVDGRFWYDTIWSRDAGTFVRELAHYGMIEQAKLTFKVLIEHTDLNDSGFLTFPEWVRVGDRRSGKELDGTTMIVIASVLLQERLEQDDPFRGYIADFLAGERSPVRYMLHELERGPYVEGSGEFGGGCGIEGTFYNVVQNGMVALTLEMAGSRADLEADNDGMSQGEAAALQERCLQASEALKSRMAGDFVSSDGAWLWCLDVESCRPNYSVIDEEINRGFGGLNGVMSHSADVRGYVPLQSHAGDPLLAPSLHTFWKMLSYPMRMDQFAKYGMWSQFDDFRDGKHTGASYGQGYALQSMLLMDLPELYTKAANWLATATKEPGYPVTRDNEFWFYERYYSPELFDSDDLEEGCGALNLVNVTEPLKAARLMIGVDDSSLDPVRIVPRLPLGWRRSIADGLPVRVAGGGIVRLRLSTEAAADGSVVYVSGEVKDDGRGEAAAAAATLTLPALAIRLGRADRPQWVTVAAGARTFEVTL